MIEKKKINPKTAYLIFVYFIPIVDMWKFTETNKLKLLFTVFCAYSVTLILSFYFNLRS